MTPTRRRWALNNYRTRCTGNSISLEIRWVGEKMLDWGTCPRETGSPGLRLSSSRERERNAVIANRVGVNMLQFCSVSNSLSHTTLSIKWEVYFSKELCCTSLLLCSYDAACICIIWVCNKSWVTKWVGRLTLVLDDKVCDQSKNQCPFAHFKG